VVQVVLGGQQPTQFMVDCRSGDQDLPQPGMEPLAPRDANSLV
jgi:hypothetical protein